MNKTFEFDPDLWLMNRALRGCSPAARGFWMDLLALMWAEGGYLTIKGKPIDDAHLARLVGEPAKSVRAWIKELGEAEIFAITEDGRMYSPELVKQASAPKKETPPMYAPPNPPLTESQQSLVDHAVQEIISRPPPVIESPPPVVPAFPPKKKPLPWFKTNNGWFKMGQQQALPMREGEDIDDYKCRVAARIEPGAHLDVLTPRQQKMVEALRPKDPNAKKE